MYTFIINPASRSGLGRQVWESLEPILRERGVPYRAYLTRCQRHATRLARELTADGKIHTIVVLGGDGTVNEVIGGIQNLSATTLDFPAICGVSMLIAFTYVVINLVIDILYGIIDPRVRYQ